MTRTSTVGISVPFVDLGAQQEEVAAEVEIGLKDVFAQASFIGGPAVAEFERAYARFLGAGNCVGVANGTDALELALRASGVTAGAEVILPANTFIATAEAVSRIGAVPVLVDVDPEYLLIDPERVAEAVTPRTRAIMPVHLFGQTAFVERLAPVAAACGAVIVEDAAQAQGASRHGRFAGTLGLAAGTSFYPGKNLGAAGDAGAVVTDDDDVAARVRMLGAHGSERKYQHDAIGMNSRLDTIQAVVLNAKLRRLARWNDRRRQAAARYQDMLAGLPGVALPRTAPGNLDVGICTSSGSRNGTGCLPPWPVSAPASTIRFRYTSAAPTGALALAPDPSRPRSRPPSGCCRCPSSRTSARRSSSMWRTGCRQPWAQKRGRHTR